MARAAMWPDLLGGLSMSVRDRPFVTGVNGTLMARRSRPLPGVGWRERLGPWSNAGVFVRVWEYEVPGDRIAAFTTAYAADGAWGKLFGRAAGFLGTELYRDAVRADRFLTIDRWRSEEDWRSFLHAFGPAYESLDAQLEGLAVAERSLFEGSS
jgi:antibiotic biosynthesis monooxygenase